MVEQLDMGEVQVGRDAAGEAVYAEDAVGVFVGEGDDLALSGRQVDGDDDAADQHEDEQKHRADHDAQPFRDAAEQAHQKACPIPI